MEIKNWLIIVPGYSESGHIHIDLYIYKGIRNLAYRKAFIISNTCVREECVSMEDSYEEWVGNVSVVELQKEFIIPLEGELLKIDSDDFKYRDELLDLVDKKDIIHAFINTVS
jgi:hypothetical protein